jgi:hypothetical protein
MGVVIHMSSMARSHMLARHGFYVEQVRKRTLSQFDDIEREADDYAQAEYERLGRLPGREDLDMSDLADTAQGRAEEYYLLISDLKQQVYLSAVAGMYHQFDKDLRGFLEQRFIGQINEETGMLIDYQYTKKEIWKPPIEKTFKILKTLGWEVKKESCYPQLDACRMVVNAYKHGKGTSLDELKKSYPEYVRSPFERANLPNPFRDESVNHEWLSVSNDQMEAFGSAIADFWIRIPECLEIESKGGTPKPPGLTKLEVARRQLVTAIRLFFDGRDEIAVFTLASNAWEIVDALCTMSGIDTLSSEAQGRLDEGVSLKRDFINSPYRNFFKHADRDPDAVLTDFSDHRSDGLLMLAVEDYLRLTGNGPVELQIYQLWYLGIYEEKIAATSLEEVMISISRLFPRIAELSRQEQKRMARECLKHASRDLELLNDSRTDTSDLHR